jgi:hypothetical protein
MLNKLWQIGIYSLVIIFIAFIVMIVIQSSIDKLSSIASAAPSIPPTKVEYGVRKTYDEDAICYTAFMQNGLESGISISCIPRPQTCDYQNKKGTQNARTISTKTNSYNTQ